MTLHRKHHDGTISISAGKRLSLKDQLALQLIVTYSVDIEAGDFYVTAPSHLAVDILERHGVTVSLDKHTGRVTFNPEVIDA